MRIPMLFACTTIVLSSAAAYAETRNAADLTPSLNGCFQGDPKPCIQHGYDEFNTFQRMQDACGWKPAVRLDEALVADDQKHNKSVLADPEAIIQGLLDLCKNTRLPGAKEELAARVKTIHFTLIPTQPPGNNGAALPKVGLRGSELVVGSFYEEANVADATIGYLESDILHDALMKTRTKILNACYAGDPSPCLEAYLGQVTQTPPALEAACGIRPAIHIEEGVVRLLEKTNTSSTSYVDEILAGLTRACQSGPAGKARVARAIKSVRFNSSATSLPKDPNGIVVPAFHRNGGEIVVTYSVDIANAEDAAQVWAAKNL